MIESHLTTQASHFGLKTARHFLFISLGFKLQPMFLWFDLILFLMNVAKHFHSAAAKCNRLSSFLLSYRELFLYLLISVFIDYFLFIYSFAGIF